MTNKELSEIRLKLGNNIKELREKLGLSKVQAAEMLSDLVGKKIDSSAFSNWEKGLYSPSMSILDSLCQVLKCNYSQLFQVDVSDNEELPNYYMQLSERQKDTVKNIIKAQLGITSNEKIVSMKLFNEPACAGDGNYISSEDYEIVEFSNPPKTAVFAVKAQGDSMLPIIEDRDILYVNPNGQVVEGDLGIFTYQGNTFVKQLRQKNGKPVLHSLNPKFKDILIEQIDELYVIGRVL